MAASYQHSKLGAERLYACGIFLGAFLLFAIQPMAGKHILPYFGGSSSVWAASLLFFTTALFVGYLYVYLLARRPQRTQVLVHGAVIAAACISVAASLMWGFYSAAVGVDLANPSFGVLAVLALSIGMPYFLLATTGPLLQYWYGITQEREPYRLYALSNIASFAALLSYPFLIEPLLPLRLQDTAWSLLFFVYAALYGFVAWRFHRTHHSIQAQTAETPPLLSIVQWGWLAALPSFLLVSTTTQITQVVAPVPLLWIVPLALYLLSFVVAFRGWARSLFVPVLFLASAIFAYSKMSASYDELSVQLLAHLLLLFFCGLYCHGELYRQRPAAALSPLFYLLVSLGGALGCLAATLLPPILFPDYWEFTVGLALVGAVAVFSLPLPFFPRIFDERMIFATKIGLTLSILMLLVRVLGAPSDIPEISSRNFYGNAKVAFAEGQVRLMHGTTLHGLQLSDRESSRLATTYYTPSSGVGRSIRYQESIRPRGNVRVGVLGLGTGTLAAYCKEGDTYVFYEIDERIHEIATTYFSYLPRCKSAEVRIGDGRILLEREKAQGEPGEYDVLAIDAFSDDTIPVHLLTLEALQTYAAHLRGPESILAVHVSNRYLDLAPVVLRLAAELDFNAMIVHGSGEEPGGSGSEWVLLTKDVDVFQSVVFANSNSGVEQPGPLWRDDYSALFPVLYMPMPWE